MRQKNAVVSESTEVALTNIQEIIQHKENDEIRALYGAGNYCFPRNTRDSRWQAICGTPGVEKGRQIENLGNTYFSRHYMSANAGQKRGYQHRARYCGRPR